MLGTTSLRHPLGSKTKSVPFSAKKDGDKDHLEVFEVLSRYEITHGIGFGTFGFVAGATDLDVTPTEDAPYAADVAIKKLKGILDDPRLRNSALRELKLQLHFDHPNVMKLRNIFIPLGSYNNLTLASIEHRRKSFEEIYLVMDKMDWNLKELIEQVPLTSDSRGYLMSQLLSGMHAIHSAGVVHRDLKPENVLINKDWELKICDFGQGRGVTNAYTMTMLGFCCTQWYRAPEALMLSGGGDQQDMMQAVGSAELVQAADTWSIGCIMAEMILGEPLFPAGFGDLRQLQRIFNILGTPSDEDLKSIDNKIITEAISSLERKEGKLLDMLRAKGAEDFELDIVSKMLQFNPEKRITIGEALAVYCSEEEPPAPSPPFLFDASTITTDAEAREEIWRAFAQFSPEVVKLVDLMKDDEVRALSKQNSQQAGDFA